MVRYCIIIASTGTHSPLSCSNTFGLLFKLKRFLLLSFFWEKQVQIQQLQCLRVLSTDHTNSTYLYIVQRPKIFFLTFHRNGRCKYGLRGSGKRYILLSRYYHAVLGIIQQYSHVELMHSFLIVVINVVIYTIKTMSILNSIIE